ncbi:MAG: SGNH/GDSL hydrolase family protein [bacterium]|nr:SGNH/GDSL hydrolase family protein [bacterium]
MSFTTRRTVRIVALAVAAIGLTAIGTYFHYFIALPTEGSGPAGPAVSREAFAKVWTERPVHMLGLGDSITAGYGARPGFSYFQRLGANPMHESPDMDGICLRNVLPNLSVHCPAVSGSTSLQCLEDQLPELSPLPEDTLGLVMLTTGGNDLIHMYGRVPPRECAMYGATLEEARPWIANFEARLNAILDQVSGLFPGGCHIFLANIYDPTDGTGEAGRVGLPVWQDCVEILAEYNSIIKRCAEGRDNVRLIDIHGAFLGHGFTARQFWRDGYRADDPHYWYYANVEDPNERGYDALRRLFLNEIVKVFDESAGQPTRTEPKPTSSGR